MREACPWSAGRPTLLRVPVRLDRALRDHPASYGHERSSAYPPALDRVQRDPSSGHRTYSAYPPASIVCSAIFRRSENVFTRSRE
jgi:hypothetical protein